MNTLKPRIASLLQQLNERVFEKEHIVALALPVSYTHLTLPTTPYV